MRSSLVVAPLVAPLLALAVGFAVFADEKKADEKKVEKPALPAVPDPWPPVIGKPFPDIELVDQEGTATRISDFKGKVLLVEPVGMGCPGCQAFSGALGKPGVFKGGSAQAGLPSFDEFLTKWAKVKPADERIVLVQLLLYDMSNSKAPTAEDGKAWAKHFGFTRKNNRVVLVGTEKLVNKASYDMVPGFFLVDKGFVLRSDATGHNPKDNMYDKLAPMISKLLK